jgi:hypothetical protein
VRFAPEQIQLLYRLERQIREEGVNGEQIETLRKIKAYPLLQAFEKWLEANIFEVLPKSPIGRAISCT